MCAYKNKLKIEQELEESVIPIIIRILLQTVGR